MPSSYYVEVDPNESGISIDLDETILEEDDTNDNVNSTNDDTCKRNCSGGGTQTVHREIQGDRNAGGKTDRSIKNPYVSSKTNDATAVAAAEDDSERRMDNDETMLLSDAENFEMEQAKSVVPREHLKDREQGIFDGSNNMDEDVSKMEIDGIENDVNPKIDGVANFTPTDTMPCGSTQPMVLRGGGPSSASYSNDNLQQNSKSFQNRLLSQSIQNAMKKVDDEDGDDYVDNLTESQLLKLLAKRQKERQRALAESLYKDSDSEKDEDSDCDGDTGDRFNFSCDVGGTGSSFASRTQSFQQYKNQKQQRHQQSVECQSTQQSIEHSFMTQETSVVNNRTVNNNLSFDFPMSEASGNKCSGPHQSNNVENIRQAKYQQDNNQYSKHLNSRNSTQPTNSFQNTNPTLEKSGIINPYQKNRQSTSQSSSLSSYNSIFSDTRNDGIERNNRTAGSVENNIRNATGEHGMNFRPTIDSTNSIKSGSGTCHHAASKLNSGGDRNPSLVSELVLDPRIQNESSQNANLGNVGDSACNDAPVQAQQRRRKSFFDKDQQPIACSSGGWEEDAFRSSLIDLLAAFPASMVFGEANTDDVDICSEMEEKSDRFCSSAYEEEGETPCSTTSSQAFESAQLQRKRYFDAASRALVRLAIASRGTATSNINDDGHRGGSDISRSTGSRAMNDECAPPSPRSLPSFISVLNVPGNCNNPIDNDQWRDNQRQRSFSTSSSSQEIFVGRSVHGRNARTVCLWSGMPKRSKKSNCTNDKNDNRDLFESWTNDRLAFLAMKVAAKVCHQSWQRWHLQYSCGSTNGLCISIEEGNTNSSRVTGFVEESQCRNGKSKTTKLLSPAIVESSLEFLATSFACLEADLVYSVLGTRLSMNSAGHSNDLCFDTCPKIFTVFDVILCFSVNINATVISPMVSTLAFLSLSRGLAAAQYVARYATSLDPSSCCSAYCSVNFSISEGTDVDDFRINDGGIGWLSALGKDLSLSLDSEFEFSPRSSKCLSGSRYSYLCLIASTVYDCIMEYDSSISSGTKEFASLCEEKQNADRKVKPQGSLFIETTGGCGHSEFRQSSIMKDRVLADKVEYLSSLIQIGVVVGWLSVEQTPNNDDSDEQNRRTVNNLCQKLFLILETRSRQRYSTNQNISKSDPGDSEAVCAACLSLLALLLERHRDSTTASSLSSSFRQMGGSSGTIQDLFESPMVQRIADMALSWSGSNSNDKMTKSHGTESERSQNIHAISYSINILSDIVKAGGGPLVRSKFPKRMDIFLTNVVESICKRGRSQSTELSSSKDIESVLLIILHLHACCSAVIRQFLRSYLEQSSAEKGVGNNLLFTSGILFLCADKSFAVSSCASFLLRALLDGSPSNRTQDHLSELLQESLNHDSYVSLALEHALIALIGVFNANEKDSEKSLLPRHLQQPDFETTNTMFPSISVARTCSLCDLLGECLQSARPICVLATAFSSQHFDDNILDIFLRASKFGSQQHAFDISTINGSAHLSLLFLLTTFSTNASAYEISEHEEESFRRQQSIINQHITNLVGRQCSNVDASVVSFSSLQAAMIQGSSVDMTHRSIKLQRNMDSLFGDARPLAFNLTFASGSLYDHRKFLQDKIKQNKCEFKSLVSKYERVEIERDNLVRALNEQRLASHRQLEWIKTEAQLTSRNSAQIHFIERKRAEERAKNSELKHRTESEARISAEHANQQLMEECERLKRELSSDKSKIQELEKMLEEERKSSQQAIISLDKCKMDLAIASDELERTTFMSNELQSKLIFSEEKTKELNASNQLLEANLEDICSKLIKLSFIYQSKEESTTKVKNELRSALIAANKHADTAIAKYETAKQENKSLRKKLDQTSQELQQAKAHRAEVQRQRKHAPISYINQLHKDPSLKDKRQQKRSEGAERVRRPGKENSFVDR